MAKKATKEELEDSIKKTQEKLEVEEVDKKDEIPEEKEPVKVEEPVKKDKEEDKTPLDKTEPTPSEPIPSPDYKEKFSESSREAQKIHAKNRKLNEGIAKATEIGDPTDEELTKEYPDWDVMSETERKLAKTNYKNEKRFEVISKATQEAKKIEKWNDDVSNFVSNPKTLIEFPKLEGKEAQFSEFANKLENHAVPFKVLVTSFLYDMNENKKPANKGKMFETGSGGPNDKMKPKTDKISLDEARMLMQTDYKKYKEYLLAGKIDSSVE